jgi:hypothetical protein
VAVSGNGKWQIEDSAAVAGMENGKSKIGEEEEGDQGRVLIPFIISD